MGKTTPATGDRVIAPNRGTTSSIHHMGEIIPPIGGRVVTPNGDATSSMIHVMTIIPATHHVVVAGHCGATSSNQHVVKRDPYPWSNSCHVSNCHTKLVSVTGKSVEIAKMSQSKKKKALEAQKKPF